MAVLDLMALDREIRDLPDPEIPVITLDDLGVVRAVELVDGGPVVRVTITPTYSGCPAMGAITASVARAVVRHGGRPQVDTQLSPPWTTAWMSAGGKEALRRFGIAPPTGTGPVARSGPVVVDLSVRQVDCPQCGSARTEELARFGSTACKALRRCLDCREPFEEFKPL